MKAMDSLVHIGFRQVGEGCMTRGPGERGRGCWPTEDLDSGACGRVTWINLRALPLFSLKHCVHYIFQWTMRIDFILLLRNYKLL